MAELTFRIKAEYDSAIACREELKKIEQEMKKLNENSTPQEIERLTKRYAELTAKWESSISNIGKIGFYARDAFSKIGDAVKGVNKEIQDSNDANETLYSTLVKRLKMEERLTEEFGKQREEAQKQLEIAKEGYNRNVNTYQKGKNLLDNKYNGQAEEFWSEKDQAFMQRGREAIGNWEKEINDRQTQIEVLLNFIDKANESVSSLKEKIGNLDLPQLDLKANIDDLMQQVSAGEQTIDRLKDSLVGLYEQLRERSDFQGAKDAMYAAYGDIEKKTEEIERLKQAVSEFSLSELISQQQSLITYAEEVSGKLTQEDAAIADLKRQQEGLNSESAIYKGIQDSIDLHVAERERYAQTLESTKKSISETNSLIENETKAQEARQAKIKELTEDVKELSEQYQHHKDIVNDNDANKEAVKAIKEEIIQTKEKIDAATDSTQALKDMLSSVEEVYQKNEAAAQNVYKGWANTGTEIQPATRVYTNESDYNKANELHDRAEDIESQLRKGVGNGSLSVEELQELQEELKAVQAELEPLETKARETAEVLGENFASKAQRATEHLYELNKSVEAETEKYRDLEAQLNNMKSLLEFQEQNGTPEQINKTKEKIDELNNSLNETKEKLSQVKAEQTDAQNEVDGLTGKIEMFQSSIVKAVGGADNFNKILSFMPARIQSVVTGLASMRAAAAAFLATPVGVAIMGIAAAFYALKKAMDLVFLWFNKSAEGQMAYAKIAGYLQGVLTRLEEIFVKLGGTIFNVTKNIVKAIAQPKKAFKAVMDFIGDQISNRLKGFVYAFIDFGETVANVFVDLWNSIKNGDLDFSSTQKSAKKVLNDILAVGTGVENVVDKIGNAVDETVQWFDKTHEVAKESSKIAQEERMLGMEIESNREKTLKLQKSMAELQATMRNTNLSKEERQKALDEYKKQLEQQTKIQADFAKKRRDLQQRKMDLDDPDTLEEMQELAKYNNDVLAAEVAQQRAVTSLQRVTNSINKKSGGKGKSKEQIAEEYSNLLDEQAQKQAKQIRENGYIIQQARINSMREGTEKTIAQMKLDYQKELDAATEYEQELTRQKLKLARQEFYKNPKNKGKAFDATSTDVSMTDQEKQVLASKVDNANNKYQQQIDSLYKSYETFDEQRERKERDYNALQTLNAETIMQKTKRLGELYESLSRTSGEEKKGIEDKISVLDKEIGLLETKRRLIEANFNANKDELQAMRTYWKEYGTFQQQRAAIEGEYANKINIAQAQGNTWEAKRLEKERDSAVASVDAKSIAMDIDWGQQFAGIGSVLNEIARDTYDKVSAYMKSDDFKKLDASNQKAYADLRQSLFDAGASPSSSPFSMATWNEIDRLTKEYQSNVKKLKEAADEHDKAVEQEKRAREDVANATDENAKKIAEANLRIAENQVNKTGEAVQSAKGEANQARNNLTEETDKAAQGMKKFTDIIGNITSGSLFGVAKGIDGAIKAISGAGKEGKDNLLSAIGGKAGGLIGAILQIIDMLGDDPSKFIADLIDRILGAIDAIIDQLLSGELISTLITHIVNGIAKIFQTLLDNILKMSTFGLLSFGGNDNHEEMLEIQNEANDKLDYIGDRVKDISDKLDESYGAEAIKTYEQLEEFLRQSQEYYNVGLQAAGNDNYGGGHMEWYHRNQNGGQGAGGFVDRIKKEYGLDFQGTSWQDLFNYLAELEEGRGAEILHDMRTNPRLIDAYQELMRTNSYDEGAIADWVKRWSDSFEEIQDAKASLYEQLTTTNEDDVFSGFMDSLYALADGSEDVFDDIAENWQKMVNRMAINSLLASDIQRDMKSWYQRLADVNKAYAENKDMKAYKDALEQLKKDYNTSMENAQERLEQLRELGVIQNTDSVRDQSATASSAEKITYDQADAMLGILTAQQIVQEQIKAILEGQVARPAEGTSIYDATSSQLMSVTSEYRDIAADSRDILAGMAIHVEEIRDGVVDTIVPRIQNIDEEIVKVRKLLA